MKNKSQTIRRRLVFLSFLLFPFTIFYLSPWLILAGAMTGTLTACIVVFAVMFLSSLFFGRAYCGWLCPMSGAHQCLATVTEKVAKNNKGRWIKYFIFVPWLTAAVLLLLQAGGFKTVDLLFMTNEGMPLRDIEGYIIYFGILLLIIVMSLILGRYSFCHTICWMAPFMVIGTNIKERLGYRSLRLRGDATACTNCGQCTKACPMDLHVGDMVKSQKMKNNECILCGQCVDVCPAQAVTMTVDKASHRKKL